MESSPQTPNGAATSPAGSHRPRAAVWIALRLLTAGVLWAYSVAVVLSLMIDDAPAVSVGMHVFMTITFCVVTGAAGAVAWYRFRRDRTSQSLLLALSFIALATFYLPHVLLRAHGEDPAHRMLIDLGGLFFPLGLRAVAARVRVPDGVKSRAGILVAAVVGLPFALDFVLNDDWLALAAPARSNGLLDAVQHLALVTQVVVTLWMARLWWQNRQPFLLLLAGSLAVLSSSSIIRIWEGGVWTPMWWAVHLGNLGFAMLLATGLVGEHRRRGSLLGAFDLNAVARLAAIVEGSDEAIYSYAKSGTIDSWNRAAEQEYGYSADEAVGRPLEVLVPDELVEEQKTLLERAMKGETIYHAETEQKRKDGAVVDMELTISPIRTPSGEVVGASVIGHNIAERKRAERLARQELVELERADELKNQFLAIHGLRTPLTSIAGFTTTMLDMGEQLTEDQRARFLHIIEQQADRLNRLIGELLTLSRVEAGKLETNPIPLVVAPAIERTVADLGAEVTIGCDQRLITVADEDHLQQILVNYLSNAIKYGAPPIFIEARATDEFVEIRVCDEGPGIPPEYVDRLFERFAQVPHEAEDDVPSTGLGLSIVRGLARANGGEAWFQPHQPHGACFYVRLPSATRSAHQADGSSG